MRGRRTRSGFSTISREAWPRMHRKPWLSGFSASPRILCTRSSWTSTSIPQNVGWQFIGHIVLMRRLSLIESPSALTVIGRPVLAWRRNPSHDARTVAAARRRPENDHLSLVGDDADQWL